MAFSDTALLYGSESTYGTAATLTRAFEAQTDPWKRQQEYIESLGFRAGMNTLRSDRVVVVNMGASGAIELDILNKGMGLMFRDMFFSTTGPTQQGATTAYLQTFTTGSGGPTTFATIQQLRPRVDSTTDAFTHVGSICTGWELTHEVGGLAHLTVNYDCQDVVTNVAAGTPTYPGSTTVFPWQQCSVTVGGSPVDFSKLSLSADYGMATDRRFLRGNPLKRKPVTGQQQSFTGELEGEFQDLTQYNNFVNGSTVAIVFTWTGAVIEGAHNFQLIATLAACKLRGSSPEVSLSALGKQTLPFTVEHDGTNPAVKLEYKSTDTSL